MTSFSKLIWSDEFDRPAGTLPDQSKWIHEIGGHGWGNAELQTYTTDAANACHDGEGNLVIKAHRLGDGFTSARLISKGLFDVTYGRLECRALLPGGAGLWSAFWSLGANIDVRPWPMCGEIDVMENLGSEPRRVFGTIHCPGHAGRDSIGGEVLVPSSLHENFHVYAVEWSPDGIAWSLDGAVYHVVTKGQIGSAWVFDHSFYLLINLAVGGWLGGQVHAEKRFPAEFLVDHVRVFS
ncbi:beta-glucanase (GH16 family) [Devosia sp. UYZn731]|uniref:glycoside hydrolase family 16 protein n=1 Tax=Devosia sp. UYZn731 TaxID=3156345 RepID=UPI003394D494